MSAIKAIETATGDVRDAVDHEVAAFWDAVKKNGVLGNVVDEAGKIVQLAHPGGTLGAIVERLEAVEAKVNIKTPTPESHPTPVTAANIAKNAPQNAAAPAPLPPAAEVPVQTEAASLEPPAWFTAWVAAQQAPAPLLGAADASTEETTAAQS